MAGYLTTKGKVILANGYNIIPIKPGEKAPSLKNWQGNTFTEKDLNRWISNGRADHGLGIPTKWTPFVDVDIQDTSMVAYMRDQIEMTAGYAPVRIGAAPKFGMVFRVDAPFTKIASKEFRDPDGCKAQVEIMGDGQQFVAWHIHPDTKKPYRWIGSDSPENTPAADLPLLTQEKARQLIKAFEDEAERRGWTHAQRSRLPVPAQTPGWVDDLDDIGPDGTEQLGLTDDELRAKVALIPNDDVPYEGMGLTWFNMLAAIHHETDGSEEGREIALEWSEKSGKHESARFTKTWESFGKGERRPVTARLIIQEAKAYEKIAQAAQVADLLQRMDFARDADELRAIAADCRKLDTDLLDRSRLVSAIQKAVKQVTGAALGVAEAREMVRYRPGEEATPDWLEGWVYLSQFDRYFHVADKRMITRIAFDSLFGRFLPVDSMITASFFALNKAKIPTYDLPVYLPTEGLTFKLNGRECVNLYSDALVPPIPSIIRPADERAVSVMHAHLRNLCPTEREMSIVMSWLRYISVHRDHPNWAVLLQGPGGDGKTIIGMMMGAILGNDNAYMLNAKTLESSFNAWSHGRLFVCIEEVNPGGHKWGIMNNMKPLISNPVIEVHPKGKDPYNVPNTQAYLALTNHRDALPVDDTDRRWFMVMSPWRDAETLGEYLADKPHYFDDITEAIDKHAGALRGWIDGWTPHPDFNAKGRAPFSHGRQQMAAFNRSEDVEIFEEAIRSGNHLDISRELVVVSALVSHLYGEQVLAQPLGQRVRKLLSEAGFDYLGRLRINGERESLWSKTPEKWPVDINRRGHAIEKWLIGDL